MNTTALLAYLIAGVAVVGVVVNLYCAYRAIRAYNKALKQMQDEYNSVVNDMKGGGT